MTKLGAANASRRGSSGGRDASDLPRPAPAADARAARLLVFVPMYNCGAHIEATLAQIQPLTMPWVAEVLVVDNGSEDGGRDRAVAGLRRLTGLPCTLLRNCRNVGLGGSHRVGFAHCLAADPAHDGVVVLHGDAQADLADLQPAVAQGAGRTDACWLGARFMAGSRREGYSLARTLANRAFNWLYSMACGRRLYDLGSGLNLFSRAFIARRLHEGCPSDLTFNYRLTLAMVAAGVEMRFFPISWREEGQVSNVRQLRQTAHVLAMLAHFVRHRASYGQAPAVAAAPTPVEVVYRHAPEPAAPARLGHAP